MKKKKTIKRMIIALLILAALSLSVFLYMQQRMFGGKAKDDRLERVQNSPNFKNGSFQNLNHTPTMSEDVKIWDTITDYFTAKNKKPQALIPSIKTNLKEFTKDEDVLVWFGHSSYFIQMDGVRFLIDPVLSGSASPLQYTVSSFKGSDAFTPEDLPEIDYLIITHDHWDHLDYKTVKALQAKLKQVITGLGNGAHFERWGFRPEQIIEKDWYEEEQLNEKMKIAFVPSRHFSGRGFKPNQTLWGSFALLTHRKNIFLGGDSGYDTHFKEIGDKYGPFDMAILENGQYDRSWKYIHMFPEQTIQASKDLKATRLFPVHSSKFSLANHSWDTPLKNISLAQEKNFVPLVTPIIGQVVDLNDEDQRFEPWWEKL